MNKTCLKGIVAAIVCTGFICCQAGVPPANPQGVITEKVFLNIGSGNSVSELTGSSKFPDHPDQVRYPSYFELHATGDINLMPPGDVFNDFGSQMVGYFYPPEDGDYVFYLCADDNAELYLSEDADPLNKRLIAVETAWSPNRAYDWSYPWASDITKKNSARFTETTWRVKNGWGGASITLTAGQAYYIEALQKDGNGGDNLSVAMAIVDAGDNWEVPWLPIPGSYLASFDKISGPPIILTQPESQTVDEGAAATFSVLADGTPPYGYQWLKNGIPVPGADDQSFTIQRVTAGDQGARISVLVTGPAGSTMSAEAILTVIPDSVPPRLVWVGGSASFTTLTVRFSEPLDPASAQSVANYQVPGLTISAAVLGAMPNDNVVVLTTSRQAEGLDYCLTVNNLEDIAGNPIAPNTRMHFLSYVYEPGWATYERWMKSNGDTGNIDAFANAIQDGSIRAPDFSSLVGQFGAPWNVGNNYAARVFAWFTPPEDGDYVFFVATDDASRLYLSTDEQPANKRLIAQESGWSAQYQWLTVGGGSTVVEKRSDEFLELLIPLQAGQRYYMELLHDQGDGGNGSDATFIQSGDLDPSENESGMHLKGDVIGTYLAPPGLPVAVAQATPNPAEANALVLLDGTGSYQQDPLLSIASWEWDLDNDGDIDATGASISVKFPAQGIYPIRLRVTDSSTPPQTDETTFEVVVANKLVPWKGTGTGELVFETDAVGNVISVTVHETGVATHTGKYTETVWLTSATTGVVEVRAANGDKLFGTLLHLSPTAVQVTITDGTGRFKGAKGRYVATLTMTGPTSFVATSTGSISSVGLSKK